MNSFVRPTILDRDNPPRTAASRPDQNGSTQHGERPTGAVIKARMKYYAWQLVAKTGLALIYFVVISDGLRFAIPPLTIKLSKVPVFGFNALADFEATHRLDLAHVFALFLLVASFSLWAKLLRVMLADDGREANSWGRPVVYRRLITTVAIIVITADAVLFYYAMTEAGWGSEGFSFTALVATAAYLTVLIFTTFISVSLYKSVTDLERGISS